MLLNYLLAVAFFGNASKPRVTIPYSPTFVAQVQSGNVASLTARDSVIQGSLKQAILYPANDAKGRATSEFATQVPAFANTDGLDRLLTRDLRGRGRDDMVARFGMSEEIGFVSVLPVGGNGSALMPGVSEVSERTRRRIDDEIRRIVREALNDAIKLLAENRHRLDTLAEALVSAETLGENEAYAAAGDRRSCRGDATAKQSAVSRPLVADGWQPLGARSPRGLRMTPRKPGTPS